MFFSGKMRFGPNGVVFQYDDVHRPPDSFSLSIARAPPSNSAVSLTVETSRTCLPEGSPCRAQGNNNS